MLSLKHAVLKPSPEPSSQQLSHYNGSSGNGMISAGGAGGLGGVGGPHQASLSYTVHHPHSQMLVSSANHQNHLHHHHHPSSAVTNYYDTNGQYGASAPAQPPPPPPSLYPSMSVNVSMNMTMHHGYGAECSQVRGIAICKRKFIIDFLPFLRRATTFSNGPNHRPPTPPK